MGYANGCKCQNGIAKKMSAFYISIFLFTIVLTSCDPACDGLMKVTNNTDSTLTFIIEKHGHFVSDTLIYYFYQFDTNGISMVFPDTMLVFECTLKKDQELELFYDGPLGTLGLTDQYAGTIALNLISDTIYLEKGILKKNIKDMNNWEIYVDKYKNGGGKSLFNFIVTNNDIEF